MISMYDHFIRILNENAQTKIALEKATMEADYAQNIDIKLKELLSIRHDIKNHLYTIDGMIKNNDLQKVHDYIHNIQNDFEDTYIIATPSGTISNILNYKYHICLNKRIRFEYEGNFSQIYVDDYRLITILGNLIDNAITATAKLDELSRLITVSINQIKSYLDITITNTHKEQLRTLGNEFLSTKENSTIEGLSMFHGIGLKNVRSTTELLNGELDIQYTNELFCVSVMIPNYSKKK
ncbi:MAG: sensor histidine kinase [Lachnospiraceae bacterium]|nr:sensor histidine kinase [Lachnospiraceae bacterium]